MTYWKTLNVVLSEGSQQCTLGIVNSAKTKSLEHKIKACPALCLARLWGCMPLLTRAACAGVIHHDIRRAAIHRDLELLH